MAPNPKPMATATVVRTEFSQSPPRYRGGYFSSMSVENLTEPSFKISTRGAVPRTAAETAIPSMKARRRIGVPMLRAAGIWERRNRGPTLSLR